MFDRISQVLHNHMRSQTTALEAMAASHRAAARHDLVAAQERERQALMRAAGAEQRVLVRDPLLREVRASLGRLERRIALPYAER